MLAAKTRSSSASVRPARRTLWTSRLGDSPPVGGEQDALRANGVDRATDQPPEYGMAEVSRYRFGQARGDLDRFLHVEIAAHVSQNDAGLGYRLRCQRDLEWSRERFVAAVKEDGGMVLGRAADHAQRHLRPPDGKDCQRGAT